MSAGLEPDFPRDEVFISRFPVHRACRDGDVGALVSLLEQLSNQVYLTAEDSCYGWTPIHWAAHYGQLACVVHLVQVGCEVNTLSSRFNQTPTHTAAFGGHPHCVVWLTEAGADVNKQDLVGEAPIHKAARSGSLECVQVLLIAGAQPHLRNASGQTAADLARSYGFHDCFCFIANAQQHTDVVLNGNGAPCGQSANSRKRPLSVTDCGHVKKVRRAEGVLEEEVEMNVESSDELISGETSIKHPAAHSERPPSLLPSSSPPANQHAVSSAPSRHPSADMCGSLHRTGSPSSCVSHRPAWWGGGPAGDSLHYGHYHGFGDTAEELSDGVHAEQRYRRQNVV